MVERLPPKEQPRAEPAGKTAAIMHKRLLRA
jgi:hypothetical protein